MYCTYLLLQFKGSQMLESPIDIHLNVNEFTSTFNQGLIAVLCLIANQIKSNHTLNYAIYTPN